MQNSIITEQDIIQAGNIELLANQVVEGFITGLHKSPYHGFSVEFAEHRQYNTGESTRYIDWKLYAKTDKLFVKRFDEETNLRCQLILDVSKSMYVPAEGLSKIKFSAVAIASIAVLLKKQRDAAGITLIDDEIVFNSMPKLSTLNQKHIFEQLTKALTDNKLDYKKGNLSKNLHLLADKIHKRSMVIIFSDCFEDNIDELINALYHLKYNKHDVVLFHVMDKQLEDDFDLPNRPLLLVDSETGNKIKIHTNAVKEQYLFNMRAFKKSLKLKCAQYKIDYIEAVVGNNFDSILYKFYVKRGKLM
ncbi:MAG: DUF58 domain-containing protein [Bacteroidia bacterium]